MDIDSAIETLNQKFTSGNAIDVERATILSSEWEAIANYIDGVDNLLAVIHRDGGHYTGQHGRDRSLKDAMLRVPDYIHCGG
jgi:hypothetical protein